MIYLSEIRKGLSDHIDFPFSIPAVAGLKSLQLTASVAFFVGANGSGKSTLMESIAIASKRIVVGGEPLEDDRSLDPIRPLSKTLTLSWKKRTPRGFFFRSEDFFNFIINIKKLSQEMGDIADRFADDSIAYGSVKAQQKALDNQYGDLNQRSHGEGFMDVFQSRINDGGFYLLDEPEAALSPSSQLSFLYLIHQMVKTGEGAQLIISTHSPILMSYPGAQIFSFEDNAITETTYQKLEHVDLYKRFLADPEKFLKRLLDE